MFKKKPTIKPAAPLRSSDRRKLADRLIQEYSLRRPESTESSSEQIAEATALHSALRNALLPDNVQTARFTTTHGPDLRPVSGQIYVGSHEDEEARALWFEIDGRMYPTVYTLWKNPDMVALLYTPQIVVGKLQGGADLMTPGLAHGPPFPSRATKNSVVAVASTDNPSIPIAVGVCELDVSALGSVRGAKGCAVETRHWLGDELWNYSPSGRAGQQPPTLIDGWIMAAEPSTAEAKLADLDLGNDLDHDPSGGVTLAETYQPDANDDKVAHEFEESATLDDAEKRSWTQGEIDTAFRSAFLYGVHHFKTSQPNAPSFGLVFPLSQSYVMSTLIQPFLPTFTPEDAQQLQIKKTSWKTIKKFLKSLDKAKIIKTREKDGKETVIIDVDFEDPAIGSFKPYRLPKKTVISDDITNKNPTNSGSGNGLDDAIGQSLQVFAYYRTTSKLNVLLEGASGPQLTRSEVQKLVTDYVERECLVSETNKRIIKLDPTLADTVFDGSNSIDKEALAKGVVPRDVLIDRTLQAMPLAYSIIRNGADPSTVKAKAGSPPRIQITLETRSGNKTVTKVSGLETYHIQARPLADELRKVCAGSTSVEPLAGAAKKTEKEVLEVMVQGPQKDAVTKALEKRGVDKRWIEVLDKTKGKKR